VPGTSFLLHQKGLKNLMLSFKELELVQVQLLLQFELSSPNCKLRAKE
jgi:hypothetical protein